MTATSAVSERAEPAIVVQGAAKHYGTLHAVDGVDLQVWPGEIFGLIGHNGAGKSTLFKMMLGLIEATRGDIRIAGQPVRGRRFRQVRRQIGYLPENVVLYDNLSARETLRFFARLKHAPAGQCEPVLERVGLAGVDQRPVRSFSKGMRQRLCLAQALLGAPRVLFLDEPTSGLDPAAIRDFYAILRSLRAEGVTILITSHILAELQERVDRLAIMANGRVQAVGSVQELRERTDTPLLLQVSLAPHDVPRLLQALDALPLPLQAEPLEGGLQIRCHRSAKMAVLGALAAPGLGVDDVLVREPSLEDVFFGLAG